VKAKYKYQAAYLSKQIYYKFEVKESKFTTFYYILSSIIM